MTDDLFREPTEEHARAAGPLGGGDRRILHQDLHPDNVVLPGAGPVLIDSTNADAGPAEVDIAMTG